MKRVVAALLGAFGAAGIAHAVSDIGLTSTTPHGVRVLPGHSSSVSITVTNHGPDAVAPTLVTTSIYFLFQGYTLTLGEPACGALAEGQYGNYSYSIALPMIDAGASVTCTLDVARDTSPYGANDLPLLWFTSVPDDPDSTNDDIDFVVGSLIDLSLAIVPISFELDDVGIAHAIDRLVVTSHGPTAVQDFTIGACTDNFPAPFSIDGDIEGGCGSDEFMPYCFDWGFGFRMPAMAPGDVYSCTIALTGVSRYEGPERFSIATAVLGNPDLGGAWLLDTVLADNHADLVIEPVPDAIFAGGFEP
jgi:hypothetical protein